MRPAMFFPCSAWPFFQKFHIRVANLQIVIPGDSGQLVGTRQRNDGQNQNQRELRSSPGLFFPFFIPSFDGLGLLAFTVIPWQPVLLAFLLSDFSAKLGNFFRCSCCPFMRRIRLHVRYSITVFFFFVLVHAYASKSYQCTQRACACVP